MNDNQNEKFIVTYDYMKNRTTRSDLNKLIDDLFTNNYEEIDPKLSNLWKFLKEKDSELCDDILKLLSQIQKKLEAKEDIMKEIKALSDLLNIVFDFRDPRSSRYELLSELMKGTVEENITTFQDYYINPDLEKVRLDCKLPTIFLSYLLRTFVKLPLKPVFLVKTNSILLGASLSGHIGLFIPLDYSFEVTGKPKCSAYKIDFNGASGVDVNYNYGHIDILQKYSLNADPKGYKLVDAVYLISAAAQLLNIDFADDNELAEKKYDDNVKKIILIFNNTGDIDLLRRYSDSLLDYQRKFNEDLKKNNF